uniref:Ymj n=1 Tax=Agrobacterium tumefaciens TaxID=358 RepID=Q9R482_AGRTU|nr:hypothetical protein [Agrobacterium tumefaciens]AAD50318.1 ymj [Agrobacterium tumefaciens]
MTPFREQIHPGQHLQGWVEGVGDLELLPQEDGSVVLTIDGEEHTIDTEDDPGETIGNVFGWQILSQLASRRLTVQTESGQHRLDPQALLLVGTAGFRVAAIAQRYARRDPCRFMTVKAEANLYVMTPAS